MTQETETRETYSKEGVTFTYPELIKEHKDLVKTLKEDDADDIKEKYQEQKAELEKYMAKAEKFDSKELDIRYTLQGIQVREEAGEFYSEGYIATTHVDRAREEDADYTALSKEALEQIVDFINSGVATIEGVGSTRTVSYRHDWVKKQDPSMQPAGMAMPPAELRQLPDGHFGVYCKTHHNKGHPLYDKIVYDVKHGYLPGYSIEFKEGNTAIARIANKTVKVIKSLVNFVGYAFADARMIANPKALIEGFGYKELVIGESMVEEKQEEIILAKEEVAEVKTELNPVVAEAIEAKPVEVVVKETEKDDDDEDDEEEVKKKKKKKEEVKEKETIVNVEEIAIKAKEAAKAEMAEIKISTRVLNTAGEEQMENIKLKEMKEALAKNDTFTFNVNARELMAEEHLVEKALADPQNYTYRGMKSNLSTRAIGKGLKIVGDIQIRGTLDSATNPSTYTQSPVEFADLFMPGIIQTFNTQHNLFGFLKKVQHPGGVYFQWKMITDMDPLSNGTFVSRDDVSVLKNYANKQNYQTPLKIARRGVSVTDFVQRYSAQSLGDLFQAEVQIQMDKMMVDVETALFAEVADGTNANPLGLEAVADSTGNTTLYGKTRSTANRLSGDALADTYVNKAAAIDESSLRNAIQKLATQGVNPSNMAFVTSPKGKSYIFNMLDTNRRFMTTQAEFGFEQKTVAQYDGIPIIESWLCNSTLATASSASACAYLIDTENDVIVMAMEPKLVGLAKVGPATEAYLEMDFAHVYMQPRKIHMIDNFSTG